MEVPCGVRVALLLLHAHGVLVITASEQAHVTDCSQAIDTTGLQNFGIIYRTYMYRIPSFVCLASLNQ